MTPPTGPTAQKADRSAPHQVPTNSTHGFVTLVNRFFDEESYQSLKAMALDFDRLGKESNDTQIAYRRNIEEINRLTAEWKAEKEGFERKIQEQSQQYHKVLEDKAVACRKLRKEQDNTAGLRDKMKLLEEDVGRSTASGKKHEARNANLEKTTAEELKQLQIAKEDVEDWRRKAQSTSNRLSTQSEALSTAENTLAVYQSFMVTLTPLEDERVRISEMIGSSFNEAFEFFRLFLGHDLSENQLRNSRSWDRVRDHICIQRGFPLPASNSAHAKRMRIVAGVVLYARALSEYVFRPVHSSMYHSPEKELDALPASNPTQERFVRAVLLEVLPDQQRTYGDACAEDIVKDVLAVIAVWLPTDQDGKLKSQLSHLTNVLSSNWRYVQRIAERIEPCFSLKTPEDWQPLPTFADSAMSGNGVTVATSQHQGSRENQPRQKGLEPEALPDSDIVKVVWPSFLATSLETTQGEDDGLSDLIHHGYVLTRADIQGARDEEMPRRVIRRAARESDNLAQKKRRDSAVFLSHGASDGPSVK